MTTKLLAALAAVAALTTTAAASDLPPYAGSHDDASYGDATHATFGVEPPAADGTTVVGSQHDDTRYAPPVAPGRPEQKAQARAERHADCHCRA